MKRLLGWLRGGGRALSGNSGRLRLLEVLHFCNDGFQAAFLLLLPLLTADAAVTTFQAGLLTSAHFLVGVLLAAPLGFEVRRRDGVALLLAGMAVYGGAFVAAVLVHGFWSAALVYLLAGIGYGLFHPIAFGLVAAAAPQDRGRALGVFTAVGDLGRVLVPALVLAAVAGVGWGLGCSWSGLAILGLTVGGFAWSRALPRTQLATGAAEGEAEAPVRLMDLVRRHRGFGLACVLTFADAVANSAIFVFLPDLLSAKGVGSAGVGLLVALFFVGSFAGKVVIGWVADRLGNVRSLVLVELGFAVVAAGLIFCGDVYLLAVGLVVLGMLWKGTLPVLLALTAERLSPDALKAGIGVNQAIVGIGTALSPLLLGSASAAGGPTAAFGLAGVLCVLTAVLALPEVCRKAAQVHGKKGRDSLPAAPVAGMALPQLAQV